MDANRRGSTVGDRPTGLHVSESMAVFDELPPEIRAALQDAANNICAAQAAMALATGHADIAALVRQIRMQDIQLRDPLTFPVLDETGTGL